MSLQVAWRQLERCSHGFFRPLEVFLIFLNRCQQQSRPVVMRGNADGAHGVRLGGAPSIFVPLICFELGEPQIKTRRIRKVARHPGEHIRVYSNPFVRKRSSDERAWRSIGTDEDSLIGQCTDQEITHGHIEQPSAYAYNGSDSRCTRRRLVECQTHSHCLERTSPALIYRRYKSGPCPRGIRLANAIDTQLWRRTAGIAAASVGMRTAVRTVAAFLAGRTGSTAGAGAWFASTLALAESERSERHACQPSKYELQCL